MRRAFRVNDSLPEDPSPRWQWQRGGWLLVDRLTGHVSPIKIPEFDGSYSAASWYRDYVAYCGVAEDGKKTFAIVAQIGRRKPVLKKPLAVGCRTMGRRTRPAQCLRGREIRCVSALRRAAARNRRLRFAGTWWIWWRMRRRKGPSEFQNFRFQIADLRMQKSERYGINQKSPIVNKQSAI